MSEEKLPNRRKRKWLWVLATLPLVALAVYWLTSPRPDAVRTFELEVAGGKKCDVTVDCFFPESADHPEPTPTVVLLHGVEGTSYYRRDHLSNARRLADQGFAVLLVHYFDPLNYKDLVYLKGGELDKTKVEQHIYGDQKSDRELWTKTIAASLSWAETQPEVDAERMFLLGYSLGGCLALSYANECGQNSENIVPRGVVVNFGARFLDVSLEGTLPPMQFHHGKEDKVIEVNHLEETVAELDSIGADTQCFVYPGQEHIITGEAANLCRTRTFEFLERLSQ